MSHPEHADEGRVFGVGALLTYTTGVLLDDLSAAYAVADYMAGRPLLTRERGNNALTDAIEASIREQCPDLPTDPPPDPLRHDEPSCRAFVAGVIAALRRDSYRVHPLSHPPAAL